MIADFKFDKTQVKITTRDEQPNDWAYWQSQPEIKRLMALEKLRQEYNTWKYGTGLKFQRVYHIVKQA